MQEKQLMDQPTDQNCVPTLRFLVVQKRKNQAKEISGWLTAQGFHVSRKKNLTDGLRCACLQRFDFFVLDVDEGSAADLALCAAIRHESGAPILATTSQEKLSACAKGVKAGADSILAFPASRKDFMYKIYYLIGKQSSEKSKVLEEASVTPEKHSMREPSQAAQPKYHIPLTIGGFLYLRAHFLWCRIKTLLARPVLVPAF